MPRPLLLCLLLVASLCRLGAITPHLLPLPEPVYTRSGINTAIFRRHALLTINDRQVISYFTAEGKIALVVRDLSTNQLLQSVQFESRLTSGLGDGHQSVNMGYSADGYLHLIWGCHGTEPQYLKLRWPELTDMASVSTEIAAIARQISYPQFYGTPQKTWMAFRRDDAAAKHYDHCLLNYNEAVGQWQRWQMPLLHFPAVPNLAYLNSMGQSDEALAFAYTIRRYDLVRANSSPWPVLNDSLRVVWSRDGGKSWNSLAGVPIPHPIDAMGVSPAIEIPPDQNLINQGGGWLDAARHYHIGYFCNDSRGIPQIFVTSFDLTAGTSDTRALTARTQRFELLGRGTQSWPLSRPAVFMLGRTLAVAYREENKLVCQFRPLGAGTWRRVELYSGELGNYEPILDYTRLSDGILTFYVQPAWQGAEDTPHQQAGPAAAFLLETSESELLAGTDADGK